jgi:nucleotide-binding universal stress UspA family protein
MRFLITIKEMTESVKHKLLIASRIADGFNADLSIIYVGKKPRSINETEVAMVRRSLADWKFYHPAFEVLQWAYKIILENEYIEEGTEFNPKNIIEENGRIRVVLPQSSGRKIRLILREGIMLDELKKETEHHKYEIAIIGKPKKKRQLHNFIQFLDTSIFIVNNFNPTWDYKILICVDDSKATKKAVLFGSRISKQFDTEVICLTASKTKRFGKGYQGASKWAQKYLRLQKIESTSKFVTGNPVDVFIKEASDNHIIVMGKTKSSEFFKFFRGSKPIHTAQKADCPVLIVK